MNKYQKIREEIKRLSEQQKLLKPQRKTINFSGNRTMSSNSAIYNVLNNKYFLMHLYMAYQKLKGKNYTKPKKKIWSETLVNSMIKKYSPDVLI